MDFPAIRELLAQDMRKVDDLIRHQLQSDVVLINQLAHYIIGNGGKRLRPLVVLLSARAAGAKDDRCIALAAIIEFIHTATLLHDDVVDASELRRGKKTANEVWSNEASVLVGDFLYSRAFQMMVEVGNMQIMSIMANSTNAIAEGEVIQLLNRNDPDTTEARYLEVIHRKTAKLFEAGAEIGALLGDDKKSEHSTAIAQYGLHLGTAFQLADDILDYSASEEDIGKHLGDDLADGTPTLPLIYVIANGSKAQAQLVRQAITEGNRDALAEIQDVIASTNAMAYTADLAQNEAQCALDKLSIFPDSVYKLALQGLTQFAVQRSY